MAKIYYDTLLHDMGEARELAALVKECEGVEKVGVEGVGDYRWHVRAAVTEKAFLAIPHPVNRIYNFSNGDRQLQKDVGNVVYICNDKGCHMQAVDRGKISKRVEGIDLIKTMDCSVEGEEFGSHFGFATDIGNVRLVWQRGVTSIDREPSSHVGLNFAEVSGDMVYCDTEPIEEPDPYNNTNYNAEVLKKTGLSEKEYLACRELAEKALQDYLTGARPL